MRSFQTIIFVLCAFLACAFAQETSDAYDATVYITSTVYRVNTITVSGSQSGVLANHTSTISAVHPTYGAGNTTASTKPTSSLAQPSPSQFTGAASSLQVNAMLAALVAGVGYLAL